MKMKLLVALILTLSLTACMGEKISEQKDKAMDAGKGMTDKVMDAGDTMMKAAEDTMENAEGMMEEAGDKMMDAGDAVMDTAEGTMENAEGLMEEAGDKMMEVKENAEEVMMAKSASYTDYEPEAEMNKKHILFFHAPWCPTCVKWENNLKENMQTVSENAVIIKVDYDTNSELAKQYEVTKQSTAVFINADGTVAKKESDPSLESVNAFFAQ